MKKTHVILYVTLGLVAAILIGSLAILPFQHPKEPNNDRNITSDTHISVTIPNTTQQNGNTEDKTPQIEDVTHEQAEDKKPITNDIEHQDTVVSEPKDKDVVEIGPSSGEDRNDEIFKEKEDQAPTQEKEEDKPVIVEDEKSSTDSSKGDAEIIDEKLNIDDGIKDNPEYKPSIGGANPFDNDTQTEINDKPVEDYIGDGENRPGEGIHF